MPEKRGEGSRKPEDRGWELVVAAEAGGREKGRIGAWGKWQWSQLNIYCHQL